MRNFLLIALGFLLGVGAARTYYTRRPEAWAAAADSLGLALAKALVESLPAPAAVDDGITYLEGDGECVTKADLEVQGVLESGVVVARAISHRSWGATANGVDVILPRDAAAHYSEGQVIKMPPGHCARQVGVWRGRYTTLPVVRIEME